MAKMPKALQRRLKRKRRVRGRISGTAERPRLSVYRSNQNIYAQLIDDASGHTVAAASTLEKGFKADGTPMGRAEKVGEHIASKAKEAGVETVVFDRNGYRYHGRVKALAEGARKGGLNF